MGKNSQLFWLDDLVIDSENELVPLVADLFLRDQVEFSPLLIYGATSTGKTALATTLLKRRLADRQEIIEESQILHLTGPDFCRQLANSIDTNSVPDFRRRFRDLKIFLLDDLQHLQRKTAAQTELIYLLELFEANDCFVVFTSNGLPETLEHFSRPLASRITSGLSVRMANPGREARYQILSELCTRYQLDITPAALDRLATEVDATALELSHIVITLSNQYESNHRVIDVPEIKTFAESFFGSRKATLKTIATLVAKEFKLKPSDLTSSSRKTTVVRARGIAIYLGRRLTSSSLEQLGRFFGNRDHTTILHACRKTEWLIEEDPQTRTLAEQLMNQLE